MPCRLNYVFVNCNVNDIENLCCLGLLQGTIWIKLGLCSFSILWLWCLFPFPRVKAKICCSSSHPSTMPASWSINRMGRALISSPVPMAMSRWDTVQSVRIWMVNGPLILWFIYLFTYSYTITHGWQQRMRMPCKVLTWPPGGTCVSLCVRMRIDPPTSRFTLEPHFCCFGTFTLNLQF